jgi:hypothetical protein
MPIPWGHHETSPRRSARESSTDDPRLKGTVPLAGVVKSQPVQTGEGYGLDIHQVDDRPVVITTLSMRLENRICTRRRTPRRCSLDFLNRANLDSLGLFILDAEIPQNLHRLRQDAEAFVLLFLGYADIDGVLDVELRLPG